MATRVENIPTISITLSDVSGIVEDALSETAKKLRQSEDDLVRAMRGGECAICDALRYNLAQAIGHYMGSADVSVRAVYWYEPEYGTTADVAISERPNLSPGMNLIVWVQRRSAALSAVIASLRSTLAEQAAHFACERANALCWMLDVQVVDDEQIKTRTGYGALVNSTFVRPLEVWQR